MKRLFLLSVFMCVTVVAAWAGDPVYVKSGSLAVLKKSATATLEFDYSATKVGEQTLDEYLQSRGEDFVRDWPSDKIKAQSYFSIRFNKKNKKGVHIISEGSGDYKLVVHVNTLDMGTLGAMFIPFASRKAGGVIMSGNIEVVDTATDEVVCVLTVDEIKGITHFSETVRIGMMYHELAGTICKLIKKSK